MSTEYLIFWRLDLFVICFCTIVLCWERADREQAVHSTGDQSAKEGTNIYVARGWAPAGRYFAAAWTRLDSTCSVGGCQRERRMRTNLQTVAKGEGRLTKYFAT